MNDIITNFYNNPSITSLPNNMQLILNHYKHSIIEHDHLLFLTNTGITTKLFIPFLFYYETLINQYYDPKNKIHCGIDFEFTKNNISLMQINFTISPSHKYIWIIDPRLYTKTDIQILNTKLLLNPKVYKILHGSESMDIPYIYTTLLQNDKKQILQFTSKFIDTRFLCEYVRESLNITGKCSIYDALLYFNTINQNQNQNLNTIHNSMGPIHHVSWSLHHIKDNTLKYAYYDVLYLNDLPKDIFKKILTNTPQYTRTYYYILKIIRFVMLERKKVTPILDFIKTNNKPLPQNYNSFISDCILNDNNEKIYVSFIISNDYIKIFNNVLKYTTSTNDLDPLYTLLEKNNFNKITTLLKLFKQSYTQYSVH